ncbi:MAG: MucB/RseB C-terminal domain-containing protein [Thioalkalispiraceae bacterium]|jgi:sigma-E factor negative regulatory protein RseB
MKNKFISVLLIVFLFPVLSLASDDYEQMQILLKKMHKAAHTLNYEGTFVYGQKDQLSSMRIIHSATDNEEKERLVSMDGSGREVIRNGDSVKCILPDTKSVVVDKTRADTQFPPAFPMSIDRLTSHYAFKVTDGKKVAGRSTQKIMIQPMDKLRYGHHLWVDKETGLLLKTHLLNERSQKLEQFMFTQISFFDEIPDTWLQPAISGKDFNWYKADETKPPVKSKKTSQWYVSNLPAGFMPDMQRKAMMPANSMPVEHMVFSDGLSSISVFIEKEMEGNKDNLMGSSRMGAVHAHGRQVDGYHVTVVGEAPLAAIKMISDAVQQK